MIKTHNHTCLDWICTYVTNMDGTLTKLRILSEENSWQSWLGAPRVSAGDVCLELRERTSMKSTCFYKDGTTSEFLDHTKVLHRTDGPAIVLYTKKGKKIGESWYIDDVEYTKEEFDTIINGGKV